MIRSPAGFDGGDRIKRYLDYYQPSYGVMMLSAGASFSPASLFAAGEQGAWYDPSDLSTLFQDTAGLTPVTAAGQAVGRISDKSGRGNHATQSTPASRPIYRVDAGGRGYLEFDGADDWLRAIFAPAQPISRISGIRFPSAVADRQVFGGYLVNSAVLYFSTASSLALFSGTILSPLSVTIPGTYVVQEVHNGASSSLRVNSGTPLTGDEGTTSTDGITIGGAFGPVPANFSRMDWYGSVHVCRTLTATETEQTRQFMASKTGVTL